MIKACSGAVNACLTRDLPHLVSEPIDIPRLVEALGLRARGLIARIPHTHRYRATDHGLHTAVFLSAVHDRNLPTGPAQLADHTSPPLRAASHAYQIALESLSYTTGLAD
jgi:hypothetical protein